MKIVKNKLLDFCNKKKIKKKLDENQIRRISDTVEYPNVYFGTFDKSYFEIPEFLLRSIISEKQDFFIFKNKMMNYSIVLLLFPIKYLIKRANLLLVMKMF